MTTKNTNSYNQEEEQQDETLQNFDKMSSDLPWNIKEKSKVNEKLDIMKEIRDQLEIIPNYLPKQNISFKELMHQVLSSIITTEKLNNNMDELRKIAILLYKIMVIQTYQ
ncbi:unnamed protein product [Rotaria magnacalcarata]|uniref:Uncharacterized protein n=1 Tax=Rotaria magnacalcarata TaxID=392030 RepID=A0A8S2SNP6_9BILA|nr:unnamed protein product [Rotaria magnacalcarata]